MSVKALWADVREDWQFFREDPADWKHCKKWELIHLWNEWVVCPRKGHDFYPDMCKLPEHDICARCQTRRDHAR